MKKAHFDFYDFKAALAAEYGETIAQFYATMWKENAGAFLEQSSKFARLVEWIDKELRVYAQLVNVFSPADKTKDYTTSEFSQWREQVHYVAELIYFRGMLLDGRTTTEQRQNISYTMQKIYGIEYNEEIGGYV